MRLRRGKHDEPASPGATADTRPEPRLPPATPTAPNVVDADASGARPASATTYTDRAQLTDHVAELLAELGVEPGADPLGTAQQLLDAAETVGHTPPRARGVEYPALPASTGADWESFSPIAHDRPPWDEPGSLRPTQVSEAIAAEDDSRRSEGDEHERDDAHLALVADASDETDDKLTFAVSRAEELEEALAQRDDEISRLKEVASELAVSFENEQERVRELEKSLAQRENDVALASSRVEELERRVAERDAAIATAASRAEELERRLGDEAKRAEALERRLADEAKRAEALERRLADEEERQRTADARASELATHLKDAQARATRLEKQLAERDDELSGATSRAESLEHRVQALGSTLDDSAARIAELEAALVEREGTIAELRSAIGTQHDEITSVAQRARDLERVGVEYRDVRSRLDAAEQRMSELLAEVSVHEAERARAVATAAALESSIDDLTSRLEDVTTRLGEAEAAREAAVRETDAARLHIAELEQALEVRSSAPQPQPQPQPQSSVTTSDLDSLIARAEGIMARAINDANSLRDGAIREAESIRREALRTAEGLRDLSQNHARDLYERITETALNSVAQGFQMQIALEQLARVERKAAKQRKRLNTATDRLVDPHGSASSRWYSTRDDTYEVGGSEYDRPSDH